jgi:hypothetical protein
VEVDGTTKLLSGLGDTVEGGDGVGGSEGSGSTTGGEGDLGVGTDDSDLLALDGRGVEREGLRVVLEEDDTVGGRLAKEGTELGSVDGLLLGIERNLRVDGKVEELEKLKVGGT